MSKTTGADQDYLISQIRDIVDFPKKGIVFRDITPLLLNSDGLKRSAQAMVKPFKNMQIDAVAGAESRGFIFGTVIALELGCGFIPIRKPGKLPDDTISQEYSLEYGTDTLEMHTDAVKPSQKILLVDDLLATGGTMAACCRLVEALGGEVAGISILIELAYLNGRDPLNGYDIHSIITYNNE